MKVCLVSMPWLTFSEPQTALGLLAAYVRKFAATIELDCHYEYLNLWKKDPTLYERIAEYRYLPEIVYAACLYPERRELIKKELLKPLESHLNSSNQFSPTVEVPEDFLDKTFDLISEHLLEALDRIGGRYAVVGLSTSHYQFFSSLALAKMIKDRDPAVRIVLGGAGVLPFPGSILKEFLFVDYVIGGEGEVPFLSLIEGLQQGQIDFPIESGIRTLKNTQTQETKVIPYNRDRLVDLSELPLPEYCEYVELAEAYQVDWQLPIESTRGCWWYRTAEPTGLDHGCHFCDFPHGFRYREKSIERTIEEIDVLTDRYSTPRFHFTDLSYRQYDGLELAKRIRSKNKTLLFSTNVRASISPLELAELWDAGCVSVAPGIEAFSCSLLQKMNKGTTVIQNLQTMKTCYELDVSQICLMVIGFPGASQDECNESASNIRDYACCYKAQIECIPFYLFPQAAVCRWPEKFKLGNIRPHRLLQAALPPTMSETFSWRFLEYDDQNVHADWSGVVKECKQWDELHKRLISSSPVSPLFAKPLYYLEQSDRLDIVDQRNGHRVIQLEPLWKEIYLFCMRIRSKQELEKQFSSRLEIIVLFEEILPALISEKLVFQENEKYLSLAAAHKREIAADRIRMQFL